MPPNSSKSSESDLESIITPKKGRRTKLPKYFCTETGCNAKFKRLDALDLHVFKHTGIKKHCCTYDDCDKTYRTITHLKRHLNTTHERVGPTAKTIACLISSCKQLFTSNTNMQRHVREVHENRKVYQCTHCTQTFTQKLKMRRHEITQHTGIYPYNCEKCGKGLYLRWQYERHICSCKMYACADCNLVFDKWTLYLKHCKDTQHGRKCYKCEHCPNTYSKPSDLKKHVCARHALEQNELAAFKCTHENCTRVYAYERNLRQHMRTAHAGQRYKCDWQDCVSEFKNAHNLAKHKRRVHEQPVAVSKSKRTPTKRKKRKDAGCAKLSNLSKLSNLVVDKDFDKMLRERNDEALTIAATKLIAQAPTEETETERSEVEEESSTTNLKDLAQAPTEETERSEVGEESSTTNLNDLVNLVLEDT